MQMDWANQPVECFHFSEEKIEKMNDARLQIMSRKRPELCNLCTEGALSKKGGAGTKVSSGKEEVVGGAGTKDTGGKEEEVVVVEEVEKKEMQPKNTKKRKKKKKKQQLLQDQLWVCLECEKFFCDGAGPEPHGHTREHWRQSGHCWVLNFEDPTMLYCFKCRQDFSLRIPDHQTSPKEMAPKPMSIPDFLTAPNEMEPPEEMVPEPPECTGSDFLTAPNEMEPPEEMVPESPERTGSGGDWNDWNSSWSSDSKDGIESNPLERTQSSVVSKDDIAMSGSFENLSEADIPSLTEKDPLEPTQSSRVSKDNIAISGSSENLTETCIPSLIEKDPLEPTQSSVVYKDNIAISGSSENLTDIPITGCSPRLTAKDTAITSAAATVTAKYCSFIRGLNNNGNTSFINVILQSLLALDSLRNKLLETDVGTFPLTVSLKQLFTETSSSNNAKDVLNALSLVKTVRKKWPKFEKGKMEDAGELLVHLLQGLKEEEAVTRMLSGNNSNAPLIFGSIFTGKECSTMSSKEGCKHSSTNSADTFIFELPIPSGKVPSVGAHDDIHDTSTLISLDDCFSLYTEEEISKWVCQDCTNEAIKMSETKPAVEAGGLAQDKIEVHRTAGRRTLITKAPEVLVIGFKRYNQNEKMEELVHFEEFLDLGPYMDKSCNQTENKYRLVGVVEHSGNPEGGHYIAYVRANKMAGHNHESNDTKTWFAASDAYIREVRFQEVLSRQAYVLFYERCPANVFHSSATGTGEKSRCTTDTDLWPQRGDPLIEPIPPPLDDISWEQQRSMHWDKRKEKEIAKKDALLLPKFWVFLDRFTLPGDDIPYYRFLLAAMVKMGPMVKMGSRLRHLTISYQDLVSHSKELAMDVCNGYTRLHVSLMETARKYMQALAERLGVTESASMQQLQLNLSGMPKTHEEMKQCLDTALLRKMNVFGHVGNGHIGNQVMVPMPDKCALVQSLMKLAVGQHRMGYSWEGDFDIDDMDVFDGEVVITKSPKLFEINPISPEMVDAMGKDFNTIQKEVLKRFSFPDAYVPYLRSYMSLLSGMNLYADWWSKPATAELLRDWIQHFLFLKPPMARSNFMGGIFTTYNDASDTTEIIKRFLQTVISYWTDKINQTANDMVRDVFNYKPNYYLEQLNYLFELLRHLSQHGTEKTVDYPLPAFPGAPPVPRIQLVQLPDELEIAGAVDLEDDVFKALSNLLKETEMHGMLRTVWEWYKFCNYPYQQ